MRSVVKWTGFSFLGLVALLLLVVGAVYIVSGQRITRTYTINTRGLPEIDTPEALAEGRRLATAKGCTDCHGANLGGRVMIDDPAFGTLNTANLTRGKGGIATSYTAADWERTIRHGVSPQGRALLIMPSHEYIYMSDTEIASIVAYIKTVTPVDHVAGKNTVGPIGRLLYVMGKLPLIPAELIDHNRRPSIPKPAISVDYGRAIGMACTGCHGRTLSGQRVPGSPPEVPAAKNLTPDDASGLGTWTEAQFIKVLREGIRPDGSKVSDAMPVAMTRELNDTELKALFLYLQSLDPVSNKY